MSEVRIHKFDQSANDIKMKLHVESTAGAIPKIILDKATQFLNWVLAPNQTELDLTTTEQVSLGKTTINMEKPNKRSGLKSLGIAFEKLSAEQHSTLFNMIQTGPVEVIIRAIPKPKTAKKSAA